MKTILLSKFLNITRNEKGELYLPFSENVTNHVDTIHASAQYAFAEISSGAYLEEVFPDYRGNVYAVLRKSEIKYKNPGTKDLSANMEIDDAVVQKTISDLKTRGIAIIPVDIQLHDTDGIITLEGTYTWFVKILDK